MAAPPGQLSPDDEVEGLVDYSYPIGPNETGGLGVACGDKGFFLQPYRAKCMASRAYV